MIEQMVARAASGTLVLVAVVLGCGASRVARAEKPGLRLMGTAGVAAGLPEVEAPNAALHLLASYGFGVFGARVLFGIPWEANAPEFRYEVSLLAGPGARWGPLLAMAAIGPAVYGGARRGPAKGCSFPCWWGPTYEEKPFVASGIAYEARLAITGQQVGAGLVLFGDFNRSEQVVGAALELVLIARHRP